MDIDNVTDNEYDLHDDGDENLAANGTPESVMPIAYWLFTPYHFNTEAPRYVIAQSTITR